MANDLNQCNFIGRLGQDPELRYTANGTAVCNFSLAVGYKFKDTESTEWVNIVVWSKLAEICGKYLNKGSQVFISGRLQTRSYDDRDGNKRYITEIVAENMQMLGKNGGDNDSAVERVAETFGGTVVDNTDDQIPF